MFGLGKVSKVTDSIGIALHHQLFAAMKADEKTTNARLMSLFTNGYLSVFVLMVYKYEGLNATNLFDKKFRWILDGILPNKLYETFKSQNELRIRGEELIELAESLKDKSLTEDLVGTQDPKYFVQAQEEAKADARLYVDTKDVTSIDGWYNYLINN